MTLFSLYLLARDVFLKNVISNFASAEFGKIKTDRFQKIGSTRFRKIRVVI